MSGAGKSRQRQSERNDANAIPTDPIVMVDFMDGRGCHARQILTSTPSPCPYILGPPILISIGSSWLWVSRVSLHDLHGTGIQILRDRSGAVR